LLQNSSLRYKPRRPESRSRLIRLEIPEPG
jgi:hypothetical protein